MKNSTKLYVVVASALLILFCVAYQGSYAYFAVNVNDERENTPSSISTADLKDLTMVGNNAAKADWIPGESKDFTFSITNPSSVKMCYDLSWTNVVNEFVNKNDLVYTLKDSQNNILVSETIFPSANTLLKSSISQGQNSEEVYTLTVEYKNTDENQKLDMNKTFSATISGNLALCTD